MKYPQHLAEFYDDYDAFFCDVWGVLHNGVYVFKAAQEALLAARQAGKHVVLLTNSPRPRDVVARQIDNLGADAACYDAIVTSGDVTRRLIAQAPRRLFWIGPERDGALFDGLDVDFVEEFEAEAVVVTGLFDDRSEVPEDYHPLLERLRGRNLPLICANPDLVVDYGGQRLWCAGALARHYALLGGRTLIAGKPHQPIYEAACEVLAQRQQTDVDTSRIMAIGDGILTDIKGADLYGIDALYIGGGIDGDAYSEAQEVNLPRLQTFLASHSLQPTAFMMGLA